MEQLLQKYYEYFLKENFQDKINIHENSEFIHFYKIIINAYDINKNNTLKNELKIFADFFKYGGIYHTRAFMPKDIIERKKNRFLKRNVSFDWFTPLECLISNNEFIYTFPSTEKHWAKVYLSIKPEFYIKTIIKLQEFFGYLDKEYSIENTAQCKFRTSTTANDAIVLRFACKEHYEKFLLFLDNNKEIYESFDIPNPFLPLDEHRLSIITDNGGSYNYFVTRMIWDYMFECREKDENVSINKLVQFIIDYDPFNDDMIYSNGIDIIEDFKYVLISKLTNKNDKEIIENIFNRNIKTYSKSI